MPGHRLVTINSDGVVLEKTDDHTKVEVAVDFVVLSMGVRPDAELYNEISKSKKYKAYNIGDSAKIGRIADATESAYQLVVSID